MTKNYLEKNYVVSSYNENTNEQMDYYINENSCKKGDAAYLYLHEENKIQKMEIVKIISRSCDPYVYDKLLENEDILLDGEDKYNADTSAEFITDNDCYLVWFKYVTAIDEQKCAAEINENIHWYELCFFGDEDTEGKNYNAQKACSYVIKTEIPPVIDNKIALKILFGEPRDPWEKELIENCTCVMEVAEDEARFFDVEELTKRVESEYGVYYTRG